ncbi:MAG: secondary thiamine-phosphate synthase enzyme YjbQ [Deltaproteobacteria bacterium]|nr:secondary thiamine-phosphate synthase enzyme YjbQ [Deltaproteobacteria bacterium]
MNYLLQAYFNATPGADLFNAMADVKRALRESQILNGVLTVFIPMGCAGVVLLENDPALQAEFKETISSLVVSKGEGKPSRKSGTGTNAAHVKGALMSASVSIPIKDGKLLLGPWQEVIVFDFDEKGGRRQILVQVFGDGAENKK